MEERGVEATAPGTVDAEVVLVVVPRDLGVAPRHDVVDPHHFLCHQGGSGARGEGEVGELGTGGLGGGAEEHGRPPLFRHQVGAVVVSRVVQGDAQVVAGRPRAVGLDERPELLARGDRTMEQELVLPVDAAAGDREDVVGYQVHDGGELGPVDLRGDQARRNQPAVAQCRTVVKGRLGELTHQRRTQGEREWSDAVSGPQGEAPHGSTRRYRIRSGQ